MIREQKAVACLRTPCTCVWTNWGNLGRTISRRLPTRLPGFGPRSGYVGFSVDKLALGQVYSEYFLFSCQSSFHHLLHIHPLFRAGTVGQIVTDVPSGLSLTPPHESVVVLPKIRNGHLPNKTDATRRKTCFAVTPSTAKLCGEKTAFYCLSLWHGSADRNMIH
jgi:hypothetical protein